MNTYEKIYLGFFKLFFKKTDTGEYSTSLLLSVLVGANVFGVLNLLRYLNIIRSSVSTTAAYIMGALLIGFHYYYFNFKKRYKKLLIKSKKIKTEDEEYTYSIGLLLVTIVFFVWSSSLVRNQ